MSSRSVDVVTVYGRENCKFCSLAKDKLQMMEIPFKSEPIDQYMNLHEGWRTDRSIEVLAAYRLKETMPIIQIDGLFLSYPETMRHIKQKQVQPKPVEVKELAVAIA